MATRCSPKASSTPHARPMRRALKIRRAPGRRRPVERRWQRDLSVSYLKLGDVEVAAGKLDAARKAYEQSLKIRERLAGADPSQRRLAARTFGELQQARRCATVDAGKLDAARKAYEQSLEDPRAPGRRRPVQRRLAARPSVSYEKLGDVEVDAGKLDAARKAYEESLDDCRAPGRRRPGQRRLAARPFGELREARRCARSQPASSTRRARPMSRA